MYNSSFVSVRSDRLLWEHICKWQFLNLYCMPLLSVLHRCQPGSKPREKLSWLQNLRSAYQLLEKDLICREVHWWGWLLPSQLTSALWQRQCHWLMEIVCDVRLKWSLGGRRYASKLSELWGEARRREELRYDRHQNGIFRDLPIEVKTSVEHGKLIVLYCIGMIRDKEGGTPSVQLDEDTIGNTQNALGL